MHIYLHSEMYAKDKRKHDIYENNVFLLGINKIFYGKSFFKKNLRIRITLFFHVYHRFIFKCYT